MPRYPSDQTHAPAATRAPPDGGRARRRVRPTELAGWLRERAPRLHTVWSEEIRDRGALQPPEMDGMVDHFVGRLVGMLPLLLGPQREPIRPLWERACELFGATAARRGLAAGEVIEEFNILRELVIRELFRDPLPGDRRPLSLREILRLNRAFDRGVTYASVGHTDALFFHYLERDGDRGPTSGEDVASEVRDQLEAIVREVVDIVGPDWTCPGDEPVPN